MTMKYQVSVQDEQGHAVSGVLIDITSQDELVEKAQVAVKNLILCGGLTWPSEPMTSELPAVEPV